MSNHEGEQPAAQRPDSTDQDMGRTPPEGEQSPSPFAPIESESAPGQDLPEADAPDGASVQAGAGWRGRRLGRYQVEERLGGGAMASVYRAVDTESGQAVALKLLTPGADATARIRFLEEARTAMGLDHPHIVRTLRVDESPDQGATFIVMELVEGIDLARLLERFRQLSILDSCAILEPIARALAYAHQRGIVHRDVKPSNILLRDVPPETPGSVHLAMLDRAVVPLLSDFGIARALDSPELTSAGRTVGTPAYMAPEQCSGEHEIDGRADIYSLGTVLYRCLVGRPPYTGTTTQILYAHVYNPLTIPDEVLVKLPLPLVDILRFALMKSPTRRYPTADRLAQDLNRLLGRWSPTGSTSVDLQEMTATMTALPAARGGQTTTSSVLVPAGPTSPGQGPRLPERIELDPESVPIRKRVERRLRRSGRENRVLVAVGTLAMAVLLVLLSVTLLRDFVNPVNPMPGNPGGATSVAQARPTPPDTAAPSVLPSVPPTDDPVTSGPDDSGPDESGPDDALTQGPGALDPAPDSTTDPPAGETNTPATDPTSSPTPAPVPVPVVEIASAWDDLQFLYARRDWAAALDTLTFILRSDPDYNQRLLDYDGLEAELIREIFLKGDNPAFWERVGGLFAPADLRALLGDIYIGLATDASSDGRHQDALLNFQNALILQPVMSDLADMVRNLEAYLDSPPMDEADARNGLKVAHELLGARYASLEDSCAAAAQFAAALTYGDDPTLADRQAELANECALAQAAVEGELLLGDLTGRLLYSTVLEGRSLIFQMPAELDTTSTLLVEAGRQPALSPDGERLAFYSIRPDYQGLAAFDPGVTSNPGARVFRFTSFTEDGDESPASWNRQGNRLVFASRREGDRRSRIYLTWANAQDDATMLNYGQTPAWNPTAELIIYNGTDNTGNRPGLWLIRSDGEGLTQITGVQTDIRPAWTPDGQSVVFMSRERHGNWELYRADLADNSIHRLTNNTAQDGLPTVSPDGNYVAFLTDREGRWQIWVVPVEGGEARRLATPMGNQEAWLEHALQWVE